MNAEHPIQLNHAFRNLLDAISQHVPAAGGWLPAAAVAGLGLLGLVLLLRGARLAPVVAGLGFAALGAAGGAFLSKAVALPLWPTVACSGLAGGLAGVLLLRLWLALFLTAALTFGGASVYYLRVLTPYVASYTSEGWNPQTNLNSLNSPTAEAQAATVSAGQELARFWGYLSQSVPHFQNTAGGIVGISAVLGVLLALIFPWAARSLWAALVGSGLLAASLFLCLEHLWPAGLSLLASTGPWHWAILGALVLISFAYNLQSGRGPRPEKPATGTPSARSRTA
jgi:hypothetical protein